jgi:hypothetical protein
MLLVSRLPRERLREMGEAARRYVETHHDMIDLSARLAHVLDAASSQSRRPVKE